MDLWEALQNAEDQPADEKASRAGAEAITHYLQSSARRKALLDQKRAEVFRTALRNNPSDLFNMESEASRTIDDAANGNPIGIPTMGIVKNARLAGLLKDIGSPVTQPWKASPTEFLKPIANEPNPMKPEGGFLDNMRPRLHQINGARVFDLLGGDASVSGPFDRTKLGNKLIRRSMGGAAPPAEIVEVNRGSFLGFAGRPGAGYPGGTIGLHPEAIAAFYGLPRDSFQYNGEAASPLADPIRGILAHEAEHIKDMHKAGRGYWFNREGSPDNYKQAYMAGPSNPQVSGLPYEPVRARSNPELAMDVYSAGHHMGDFANTSFDSSFAQFSSAIEAIADGQNIHPALMAKFPTLRKLAEARGQKEDLAKDLNLWQTLKNMRPQDVMGTRGDRVPRGGFMDETGHIWRQRDTNWIRDAIKTHDLDPVVRQQLINVFEKLKTLRDF